MVPHRDIRPALRDWQARLFAAGLPTVWAFPPVIPLAAAERGLGEKDLGALAGTLRQGLRRDRETFVAGGPPVRLEAGGGLSLWGLPLGLSGEPPGEGGLPARWARAVRGGGCFGGEPPARVFSPLILCAFISAKDGPGEEEIRRIAGTLPPPELRFRAAAAANLVLAPLGREDPEERPFDGVSFAWKLGKMQWLPKNPKN